MRIKRSLVVATVFCGVLAIIAVGVVLLPRGAHAASVTYNINTATLNTSNVTPTVNNGYEGPVIMNGSDGSSVTATIAVILSSGQIYNTSGANITSEVTNASAVLAAFQSIVTAQAGANATLSISSVQGFNPAASAATAYTNGTMLQGTYLVLYGSFDATGDVVLVDQSPAATSYESVSQINVPLATTPVGSLHTVIVKNASHQSNSVTFAVTSSATQTPPPSSGTNGVCGSSNGQTYSAPPTTNLCSVGTVAYPVAGKWQWTCSGSNGGSAASCSATYQAAQYAGTLSLSVAGPNGNFVNYNTGALSIPSFMAGAAQQYSLSLAGGPANTSVNICAKIGSYTGCTPSGSTGQDGSWKTTGTWSAATTAGQWIEWACFGDTSACNNGLGTRTSGSIYFTITTAPSGTIVCPFTGPLTTLGDGQFDSPYFLPNPQEDFFGNILPLNNLYYATPAAASQLASCIGDGATVVAQNPAYAMQPEQMIQFSNGNTMSAGDLIALYIDYGGIPPQGTWVGAPPVNFVTTVEQEEDCTTTNYSNPICPSSLAPKPIVHEPITGFNLHCNQSQAMLAGTETECFAFAQGATGTSYSSGSFNPAMTWSVTDGSVSSSPPTSIDPWNMTYGHFHAPATVASSTGQAVSQETVTVTVTSVAYPSVSASENFVVYQLPSIPAVTIPAPPNYSASCSSATGLTSLGPVPAASQSMRYVNVAVTNSKSFVGFNEFQVYDASGTLINIPLANVWVSSFWINQIQTFPLLPILLPVYNGMNVAAKANPSVSIGPMGLVDGDLGTGWNTYGRPPYSLPGPLTLPDDFDLATGLTHVAVGSFSTAAAYTAPYGPDYGPCNGTLPGDGSGVPECDYSGMITVDLGSVQQVSRISLNGQSFAIKYGPFGQVEPDPTGGIYTISGSTDGSTFTALGVLGGPNGETAMTNNKWIDFTPATGLFDIRSEANPYPGSLASCSVADNPTFSPTTFTLPSFSSLIATMQPALNASEGATPPPSNASGTPPAGTPPPQTPPSGVSLSSTTAQEGGTLTLTGTFGASGNTVSIITPSYLGGTSAGATIISQSATQIVISLANVAPGSYEALVTTPSGPTTPIPFTVTAPGSPANSPSNPPAGSGNCTSSANASTLLTLQQSLQAIDSSLTTSSSLSSDVVATLQAVVSSLAQILQQLLGSGSACLTGTPPVASSTVPIAPPATTSSVSSIVVTAPMFNTGTSTETQGQTVVIKWTGGTPNVNVELFQNNAQVALIADNITNTGSYSWTIPNIYPNTYSGSGYQIVVDPIEAAGASPVSKGESGMFTIVMATPPIDITGPTFSGSSATEVSGQSIPITWTGGPTNVNIELFQNGIPTAPIAEGVGNTGTYTWTVPNPDVSSAPGSSGFQIVVYPATGTVSISNSEIGVLPFTQGTWVPPKGFDELGPQGQCPTTRVVIGGPGVPSGYAGPTGCVDAPPGDIVVGYVLPNGSADLSDAYLSPPIAGVMGPAGYSPDMSAMVLLNVNAQGLGWDVPLQSEASYLDALNGAGAGGKSGIFTIGK